VGSTTRLAIAVRGAVLRIRLDVGRELIMIKMSEALPQTTTAYLPPEHEKASEDHQAFARGEKRTTKGPTES